MLQGKRQQRPFCLCLLRHSGSELSARNLSSDDKSRLPKLQTAQDRTIPLLCRVSSGNDCRTRTRWHIKKLEQLLRAVNNDAVEISDLAVACLQICIVRKETGALADLSFRS